MDRTQLSVGEVCNGVEQGPGHPADVVELRSCCVTRGQACEADVRNVPTPDRLGERVDRGQTEPVSYTHLMN